MSVKRILNNVEKQLQQNIISLKTKSAKQLNDADKDAIIIFLAKKFNLIKTD